MRNTTESGLNGLDFTILTEGLLDQGDDKVGSESRVLGIEQDLNFELTLEVADGAVWTSGTCVAGNLVAKSLGVQEGDQPMTIASIIVSLNSITNIGELNVEEILADLVASKNATARRIVVRLRSK